MNERLEAIKQSMLASFQRTRVFYSSHRGLLLSGLTVLSILLIVWARFGFTFEVSRFFASNPPSITFKVNGQTSLQMFRNNTVKVTWATDADECHALFGPFDTQGAPTGSFTTEAITNDIEFKIGCTKNGVPGEATAPVTILSDALANGGCGSNTNNMSPVVRHNTVKRWFRCDGLGGRQDWQNVHPGCGLYLDTTPKDASGRDTSGPDRVMWSCKGPVDPTTNECFNVWFNATGVGTITCTVTQGSATGQVSIVIPAPTTSPSPSPSVTPTPSASVTPSSTPSPTPSVSTAPTPYPPVGTMVGQCTGGTTPRITLQYNKTPPGGVTPNSNGMNKTTIDKTGHQVSTVQLQTFQPTDKGYYWEWVDTDIISGYTYTYRAKYTPAVGTNTVQIVATVVNCGGNPNETPTPSPTPTLTPSPTITATTTPVPGPGYTISVSGRNATTAGLLANAVELQTGQQVEVVIAVLNTQSAQNTTGGASSGTIVVRAVLPAGLEYVGGSTSVGGVPTTIDSIATGGLALGTFTSQQQTAVVFRARAVPASFSVGTTQLSIVVGATVANANQQTATLPVTVTKAASGVPGTVKTGPGDAVLVALLVSAIMTLLYVSYSHTSAYKRKEIEAITQGRDPLDFRS